jgi:hypothetical protein
MGVKCRPACARRAKMRWCGCREWAEERGLEFGAETSLPLGDGTRPDYD